MNNMNLQENIYRIQEMMGFIIESDSDSKEGEFTEKWSEKYKKSIDCNNPKGFSQKAHCAGKHTEMKEDELDSKIGEEAETTEYARTLVNTRKQGVGLRFPKSAIKNNPQKFRYYTRQDTNEGELTEKCWAGYTQKGMKTMFGKEYPNCIKKVKKK
jgi:hypothetical protein